MVNTIAFFSLEEFTNSISVVRTGLLRELVMPLFPFEYTDVFNFHHIATHFLPSVFLFVRIWWMRFWLEFYFSRQAFYPCVVYPNLCCPQSPIFQCIMLSTFLRKLGNVNSQLNLSHRNIRAFWRLLWSHAQLLLLIKEARGANASVACCLREILFSLFV